MPFTPIHMGPGILVKSILGSSFSLMVFGWTQIIIDLQPLYVLIQGEGRLHGFSHTYIGAIIATVVSALTGKRLSEFGLFVLRINPDRELRISWMVVFVSAFVGAFSHVFLDSIMHSDVRPFFPLTDSNIFLQLVSTGMLHIICLMTGFVGGIIYFALHWKTNTRNKQSQNQKWTR